MQPPHFTPRNCWVTHTKQPHQQMQQRPPLTCPCQQQQPAPWCAAGAPQQACSPHECPNTARRQPASWALPPRGNSRPSPRVFVLFLFPACSRAPLSMY